MTKVLSYRACILLMFISVIAPLHLCAQAYNVSEHKEIQTLKKELSQAEAPLDQIKITLYLATIYQRMVNKDSSKAYARTGLEKLAHFKASETSSDLKDLLDRLQAEGLISLGAGLAAQYPKQAVDTLKVALQLLEGSTYIDKKALGHYRLGIAYGYMGEKQKAIDALQTALTLFKGGNNRYYTANTYLFLSFEYRYLGNYGDALENSIAAYNVARSIKDTIVMGDALLANGFNFMLVKDYDEALKQQNKALQLFQLQQDSIGIATIYNDMGVTHIVAQDYEEAIASHRDALEIRKEKASPYDISSSHIYLAECYFHLNKVEQASFHAEQAIVYAEMSKDIRLIASAYFQLAKGYFDTEDYKKAIKITSRALEVTSMSGDIANASALHLLLSKSYRNTGNRQEALYHLIQADSITLRDDFLSRKDIYQEMMTAYAKEGDYRNAYKNSLLFQEAVDSAAVSEKSEKIAGLTQQLIYENKKALQKASQDKRIALQESQIKQQKVIRNTSIVGLLIVIGFATAFFIKLKEKRKLNLALQDSITDLKTTQEQLIQAEKMASLGELTAGIAHEIQNPLNFVKNFSEVSQELLVEMQDELAQGHTEDAKEIAEDVVENLGKIIHHGQRADGIVKGMLQHSRSNKGEKELTDINKLADEYLRLAYHGLRAKDKSFNALMEADLEENLKPIVIVPQDIGRVILNLITNAFQACSSYEKVIAKTSPTPYQPKVTVSTEEAQQSVLVKVIDNGPGIPPEHIEKIFQPFYTTKTSDHGTGLGLSLSYDIVKAHGGHLEVNTKENEGTQFTLTLPRK